MKTRGRAGFHVLSFYFYVQANKKNVETKVGRLKILSTFIAI